MGECKLTRRGKGETPVPPTGKKYLYNEGDECVSLTGGWANQSASGRGVFVFGTSSMTFTHTKNSSSNTNAVVTSANKVDLSGYSTLNVIYKCSNPISAQCFRCGVMSNKSANLWDNTEPQFVSPSSSSTFTQGSVSISSITGEYYIACSHNVEVDKYGYAEVSQIWLE